MAATTEGSLLDDLEWRGMVAQVAARERLEEILAAGQATVYCGFDPTADSMHIGNLVPLLALARFQRAGHRPIVLIGGGTGLIGDPSGRSSERTLQDASTVADWAGRFRKQAGPLLDFDNDAALLLDNREWLVPLTAIELLRDVGKHFPVGVMLGKESVRARMDGEGLSYTEFSYMVLQAYDFLHLWRDEGCLIQIGGSDQYGNITAGMDLIRRVDGKSAAGMTFPLVTNAAGEKFGKSVDGAIWLDPERTSPYAFYQFWINTEDRDVVPYLKLFTFLDREQITELEGALAAHPERREAQRALASEMTTMLHGAEECAHAIAVTEALFGSGPLASVDPSRLEIALESAPTVRIDGQASPPEFAELLVQTGLAKSISDAVRLVDGGGVSANDLKVGDARTRPSAGDFLGGRLLVLRRGKRSHALVVRS